MGRPTGRKADAVGTAYEVARTALDVFAEQLECASGSAYERDDPLWFAETVLPGLVCRLEELDAALSTRETNKEPADRKDSGERLKTLADDTLDLARAVRKQADATTVTHGVDEPAAIDTLDMADRLVSISESLYGRQAAVPGRRGQAGLSTPGRIKVLSDIKAVVGIDPGLDGAVAMILSNRVEAHVTPTLAAGKGSKRRYDAAGMVGLLVAHPVELAVIEALGPMPGQGVASMFRFGEGFGLWLGMLAALKFPFQTVTPQAWKKVVLAGTVKDKSAAVEFVQRRFPGVSLLATRRSRVSHDGLADALALAEYGRRLLGSPGRP